VPKPVERQSFKELLSFAHELADLSGPAVMQHFRKPISVENKASGGAFDPVTKADRGAERVISQALKARFPDHGMVGEEYGSRNAASRYQWVIDPIDGTRAFIMGSPLWGTLIGLLDDGQPSVGLMDQPFTGERYWSAASASYLQKRGGKPKRIKTRACPRLEDAILTSTHPDLFEGAHQEQAFASLKSRVRMTRYGGDCYGYALLAAGFVDLIIESGLKSYDIVALIPIIERAGGRITTWDGQPATSGGSVVASGDPRLHDAALTAIAKSRR
jgi:histidinol phosphatase-like enzyme (inositol monophosphatase family)